jgi:hypothetical protein
MVHLAPVTASSEALTVNGPEMANNINEIGSRNPASGFLICE